MRFRSMHGLSLGLGLSCLAWAMPLLAQGSAPGGEAAAVSTELPRRASIGLGLRSVEGEAVIAMVKPGAPAERAGIQAGDVLLSVNSKPIAGANELTNLLRTLKGGTSITLRIRRDEKEEVISVTLDSVEAEAVAGSTVTYSSVVVPAGYRLRTIITEPQKSPIASKDGRLPAFFFVQGIYCSSLDRPSNPDSVDTKLVHAMAKAGFVTIRVDKSGLGDSEGPACGEIGFGEELEGFKAALKQLAAMPNVDPDRIYLFGHSMGGVMAPYLSKDTPVRGTIVYGTLVRTWFEYQLENTRRQMALSGATPSQINDALQGEAKTSAMVLIDGKTMGDVWERFPELRAEDPMIDKTHIASRHVRFFKDLQELNLARAWEESTGDALAIHGEFDWVTDATDHEMIAQIVNERSPGGGTHVELAKADHAFTTHATLKESVSKMGKGTWDSDLPKTVLEWIAKVEGRESK